MDPNIAVCQSHQLSQTSPEGKQIFMVQFVGVDGRGNHQLFLPKEEAYAYEGGSKYAVTFTKV